MVIIIFTFTFEIWSLFGQNMVIFQGSIWSFLRLCRSRHCIVGTYIFNSKYGALAFSMKGISICLPCENENRSNAIGNLCDTTVFGPKKFDIYIGFRLVGIRWTVKKWIFCISNSIGFVFMYQLYKNKIAFFFIF